MLCRMVARVLAPLYRVFGPGSRALAYEWSLVRAICCLSPSMGVLYMWAGAVVFMAPVVLPDRSLSPRTVGGSYTRKRTYSTGSVSRPPGMAAPYLLTPMPPASPEIFFFKVRTRIGLLLISGRFAESIVSEGIGRGPFRREPGVARSHGTAPEKADIWFPLDEQGREGHPFCSSLADFPFPRLLMRIHGRISVCYGPCRPGTSYSAPVIARVLASCDMHISGRNEPLSEVFPRQVPCSAGG
jgi:hypothetical protein